MILDLSLSNLELYKDCEVRALNGSGGARLHLATPPQKAVEIVKMNLFHLLSAKVPSTELNEITLTGKTTQEVYLAACAVISPIARKIFYQKGKERIQIM